ncbi:MAG TPA: phosphatidylglycerol lysyltransferase domain-containing protein [Sphaerochaeta sp.]|nr:phosphatidylglycerol lysyltransferase domain-containing protein [Sphaerochaeta sp.]HQB04929.1 phosphatidylglycerol lysyltransferase domain-containing protein [Sphaerochaeta sp.]
MLEFYPPTLADKNLFPKHSRYLAYNYYYSYVHLWSRQIGITIAKNDTALYMHLRDDDCFLLPITDDLPKAMSELEEHSARTGLRFQLECVPESEALKLQELGYSIQHVRNLDDYLYESSKLTKLSGRKLQAKRNHISQFERTYTYTVRSLSKPEMRQECYEMASTRWLENHGEVDQSIIDELSAIRRTFDNWDELGFVGMLVCVDNELTAFTVGEIIDERLAIVHFEKGDTSYHGVYSVINQLFVSEFLRDVQYVNRQEDAGVDGLRKAKLSYQPDLMVRKYRITKP